MERWDGNGENGGTYGRMCIDGALGNKIVVHWAEITYSGLRII